MRIDSETVIFLVFISIFFEILNTIVCRKAVSGRYSVWRGLC